MRVRLGLGDPLLLRQEPGYLLMFCSQLWLVAMLGLSSAIALPSTVGGNEGHFMYYDTLSTFISSSLTEILHGGGFNALVSFGITYTLLIIVLRIQKSPCVKSGMNFEVQVISRVTCDLMMLVSQ